MTLQGPGAYDAAVYCASVSAARRQMQSRHTSRAASSPNLDAPLDSNDLAPQEGRPEIHRTRTLRQPRQVLRPEEFLLQNHAAGPGESPAGGGSSPVVHSEGSNRQHERGRKRNWARVGSKIRALFRMKK